MDNILACRINRSGRLEIARELGIRNVEIAVANIDDVNEKQKEIEANGMRASSIDVRMDVTSDDGIAHVNEFFDKIASIGTKIIFTSVKAEDSNIDDVYDRLRRVGDCAKQFGLTVALETHPDLIENSDNAKKTMEAVNHPNVRINFDPANLYYYNPSLDACEELEKLLPYVAAIHLKDSSGEYRSNDFPPIGHGVVDFSKMFRILKSSNFDGPLTFEIEGQQVKGDKDNSLFRQHLEASLEYLDGLAVGPKRMNNE